MTGKRGGARREEGGGLSESGDTNGEWAREGQARTLVVLGDAGGDVERVPEQRVQALRHGEARERGLQ